MPCIHVEPLSWDILQKVDSLLLVRANVFNIHHLTFMKILEKNKKSVYYYYKIFLQKIQVAKKKYRLVAIFCKNTIANG